MRKKTGSILTVGRIYLDYVTLRKVMSHFGCVGGVFAHHAHLFFHLYQPWAEQLANIY
jgi:uncharacterized membrane protein